MSKGTEFLKAVRKLDQVQAAHGIPQPDSEDSAVVEVILQTGFTPAESVGDIVNLADDGGYGYSGVRNQRRGSTKLIFGERD